MRTTVSKGRQQASTAIASRSTAMDAAQHAGYVLYRALVIDRVSLESLIFVAVVHV